MVALLSLIALSVWLAAELYIRRPKDVAAVVDELPTALVQGSRNKWYVDEIYGALIIQPIVFVSRHVLSPIVDAGIIDGIVNGVGSAARGVGGWYSRSVQIGQVQAYALAIAGGTAVIVVWVALSAVGS
jgi:NADH-quinone oxidoreductase subunit L